MQLFQFTICRWKLEHSRNFSFYCSLWHHTLNTWWATSINIRSCRTHCYNVHLSVQLCQRKGRIRAKTLLGVGWMVLEICFVTCLKLFLIFGFFDSFIFLVTAAGFVSGQLFCCSFLQYSMRVL